MHHKSIHVKCFTELKLQKWTFPVCGIFYSCMIALITVHWISIIIVYRILNFNWTLHSWMKLAFLRFVENTICMHCYWLSLVRLTSMNQLLELMAEYHWISDLTTRNCNFMLSILFKNSCLIILALTYTWMYTFKLCSIIKWMVSCQFSIVKNSTQEFIKSYF